MQTHFRRHINDAVDFLTSNSNQLSTELRVDGVSPSFSHESDEASSEPEQGTEGDENANQLQTGSSLPEFVNSSSSFAVMGKGDFCLPVSNENMESEESADQGPSSCGSSIPSDDSTPVASKPVAKPTRKKVSQKRSRDAGKLNEVAVVALLVGGNTPPRSLTTAPSMQPESPPLVSNHTVLPWKKKLAKLHPPV